MPAKSLLYANREVFFQKAITTPDIGTKTVLARDAFQFIELWLRRKGHKEALFYWTQAHSFFSATKLLPATSSPLTSYYCMLNAVKTLLIVNNVSFSNLHGVSGEAVASRKSLENETSELHNSGIVAALSKYLQETEVNRVHSLEDIFANLPFIHRAYSLTRREKSELFIALKNVAYVRHPSENRIWLAAEVSGLDADRRVLRYIPDTFQIDEGVKDRRVIRRKARINWFAKQGASSAEKANGLKRLHEYHRKLRVDIVPISAPKNLWYLKRRIATIPAINRYGLTLIIMGCIV